MTIIGSSSMYICNSEFHGVSVLSWNNSDIIDIKLLLKLYLLKNYTPN